MKVTNKPARNPRSFGEADNPFIFDNPLDFGSQPLTTIRAVFEDLTRRVHQHASDTLKEFCEDFSSTPLKILTFCSGTESPVLGLEMFRKSKLSLTTSFCSSANQFPELESDFGLKFLLSHEGSAEIQPEKAAYIQRNFPSKVILRDIIEFVLVEEDSASELLL